jgi:radical SAM superfamily enzyme YgiQ (UPF0313 family)
MFTGREIRMTTRGILTIGQVQINNSFSGQSYLPYSLGVLQAYVQRHAAQPERYRFLLPVYKRLPIGEAVEQLLDADVVGFSTYVWNARISLEIARRLKAVRPGVSIVFGGPHVPDQSEKFLRENRFIDVAVHGEGERAFLALLEGLASLEGSPAALSEVPGISRIDADGRFQRNPPAERIRDLAQLPSPFLDGVFEPLMAAYHEETWIGLWETNRGCPFQCTFCDWGSATASKVSQFEMDRLHREVQWFSDHRIEYIFCCDANFGILKRDVDIARYVAEVKGRTGYPQALSVQNTKNATERAYETQKILSDAGLNKGVALSMQSIDASTLTSIKRQNISLDTYLELQRRFTRDRVETYSDLILGLPGETYESFVSGVDTLIESGQHNRIQFNNLSILPNAEMGDPDYQARYGMVTAESRIINIHGRREELEDDVPEIQQLVVATAAMPADDWRRTRAFCWMAAFLHFDKLFQIPFITARTVSGVRYRALIEAFLDVDRATYPMLGTIRDFFLDEARSIQEGGPEYVYAPDWLGIYWPADEYMFIKLTAERTLDVFYEEAARLVLDMVGDGLPAAMTRDAIRLNRALIKQPFSHDDLVIETEFDVRGLHGSTLWGEEAVLRRQPGAIHIDRSSQTYDFSDWCREVVWYGNKKGAYLYGNRALDPQLSGHF